MYLILEIRNETSLLAYKFYYLYNFLYKKNMGPPRFEFPVSLTETLGTTGYLSFSIAVAQ